MKITLNIIVLFLLPFLLYPQVTEKVKMGDEIFLESKCDIIHGKNIAIVTNHTAILPDNTHFVDALIRKNICNIRVLFTPEHGFRGKVEAGNKVSDTVDISTGIRISSLYGKNIKPNAADLVGIDYIIYDIQDVGARYYTYISTLYYIIQAAAENNIKVIVLDRVNPNSGNYIAGPTLKDNCKSFVGICKIPLAYGLTPGELALLMNGEQFLGKTMSADVEVVKVKGWSRDLHYSDLGRSWVAPSPNLQSSESANLYLGLGLLEGTNISEGRGTKFPFQMIGAPYLDSDELIKSLDSIGTKGYKFSSKNFVPRDISGVVTNPKYKNVECKGVYIEISDIKIANPYELGIKIIYLVRKLHTYSFTFNELWFDKLAGDKKLREMLAENYSLNDILDFYRNENEEFSKLRQKYLLYN